ncbi:citrate lyase subunit alpha/citrate CoA-transferase [Lacrimispora xylanisolvens]|uniref:Citrate lyase alpha chain n=1 Tax=Lacrimispora xylanisolvens TaxID=384636 RepID=A0A2S6HP72_9FIRM|nr:citrate lyase subunit alpha [Hungatella xylanolytica]MBE5989997.1 citrate lyase subunit alpha [Paenibacillaceae bacterium]MTK07518.1 citrate lyase subunit alpha [Hungatella sp.]PPK79347.1 citrate lyase subunit alpha/citrate CoA-transferase [Hungatella xylanolytica]
MINAVGREIPEEILKITGKEPFKGNHYFDGYEYKKDGPSTRCVINSEGSKLVENIHEVLVKCGIQDGMTLGFHHHFRDGDYVVNMVMEEIHNMGIKDITICASSLGKAHDKLVEFIEDGTITNIQSSGVRGKIGRAISEGKLKGLAVMRSHGGRVRAIETGEVRIDIAFIGSPTCDDYGNCRGIGGKSDCGVLSYSMVDADYADKVVAITDCLVPFPNFPAHISMTKVDYVVVVDEIGNPDKIATGAAKPTTDMRKLMMADYCTQFVVNTPYFKDGFSYQTGVGGASIASTISLSKIMKERNIRMKFGVGGLTKPMCDLLENNQVDALLDTQDFDLNAVESVINPRHFRISAGEYADPFNKGAVVNKLDFVILAALEVDVNFNCNVVVGSDGIITGAQGGHPDTAAGAKCTIVIAPLLQGRIPAICTDVTTVTTPGESIDVVITDYGIAVNPRRQDLIDAMKNVDLPFKTIEELRDIAYSIVGEPERVQFDDKVVGIIEGRDGTVMDVVRKIKKFEFSGE